MLAIRAKPAAVAFVALLYIVTSAHVGLLQERDNTLAHVSEENQGWGCRPEPFVERRRAKKFEEERWNGFDSLRLKRISL